MRGLHLHRRQLDRWIIGSGRAFVALVDLRPLLAGGDGPLVETRELAADDWVQIPARVAHGFMSLEPVDLVYLVTNEYDGSDEAGFAWDDRLAAVPWPLPAATPDGRPDPVGAGPLESHRSGTSWCVCASTRLTALSTTPVPHPPIPHVPSLPCRCG